MNSSQNTVFVPPLQIMEATILPLNTEGVIFSAFKFLARIPEIYLLFSAVWFTTSYLNKFPVLKKISEVCICNLTLFLLSPAIIILVSLVFLVRHALTVYFELFKTGNKYKLMNPADAAWGFEEQGHASAIVGIYILEGRCDLKKLQKRFLDKFVNFELNGEKIYERLKYKKVKKLGFYCWEDCGAHFEIGNHVKYLEKDCDPTTVSYTEDKVLEICGQLYNEVLPGVIPNWEINALPNFIYKEAEKNGKPHYALLFRVHHCLMDGISGGLAVQNAYTDYHVTPTVDPLKDPNIPPYMKLFGYVNSIVLGPHSFLKSLWLDERNCFHSGRKLTGGKTMGWSSPVDLELLKRLKSATKTTTTAILISALGSSLRKLAIEKKLKVPTKVHALLPVGIIPYPNMKPQNRFSGVLIPLQIGLTEAKDRLTAAHRSTKSLTTSPDILMNYWIMKLSGFFPSLFGFSNFVGDQKHSTFLLSNVPGPTQMMSLCGDLMTDAMGWSPIQQSLGIGMTLFSYCGIVRACVVFDDTVSRDKEDMKILTDGFEREILKLAQQYGSENKD